jgi:5-methylcytosine-specific restriction protein B
VQGYRPSAQGFRLKNGLFYDFCEMARNDPAAMYVFAIDEINRGNLSKVFGEIMMLIEPDKRGPTWAIPLAYSESGANRFSVPENVYLIGLMNTADRSLAMVDYALRRRFAFVDLVPAFETDEFDSYLEAKGADPAFISIVVSRLTELNKIIANDTTNLGPGYRVGHSYFCTIAEGIRPDWLWYSQVIRGDVEPLLREYYFDNPKLAAELTEKLLKHG